MARLTRKQERLLRRTADGVRMYVACLTVAAPLMCVLAASAKYAAVAPTHATPEIPPMSTWGNISGIYLPMFAAVGAYVWATRAAPVRSLAPNGFAMALFRDAFTFVVMTLVLLTPWMLYRSRSTLQSVNAYVVWYQTVLTVVAGGAFAYYFNGRITADRPAPAAEPAPGAAGRRAARREEPVLQPAAEG